MSGDASSGGIDPLAGLQAVEEIRKQFNIEESRNIAFAEIDIDGEQDELIAVSGVDSPPGTAPIPANPRFQTFETPPGHVRAFDAEVKLLEAVAAQISQNSSGSVRLFSEFIICGSCENVIAQFESLFPNVQVTVTHG